MENNNFQKIELMAIVNNDLIRKSDAVICLEGDQYNRIKKTVEIFKNGLAKNIVISGGFIGSTRFSITAGKMLKKFPKDIQGKKIILEENSQHTYEQGREVMKIVKSKRWKKVILVASNFHQPRAYLTFLKAMQDMKIKIQIFNAPARDLSWFEKTSFGLSRLELLKDEFKKIDEYGKKGNLVSISAAIKYQKWKEAQK